MRHRLVALLVAVGLALSACVGSLVASPPAVAAASSALAPGDRVVGIARTADGQGYWLVAAEGSVLAHFGDAGFHGSMAGRRLAAPVVGMAATPDGGGYWLVAADGGVFAFGDAVFSGSLGGSPLSPAGARVVGIGAFPDESHYWLLTDTGELVVFGFAGGSWPSGWAGVFTLGGAGFHGSMGGRPLAAPVVGMVATPTQSGYWLVGADGGVFAFGDAPFLGSAA